MYMRAWAAAKRTSAASGAAERVPEAYSGVVIRRCAIAITMNPARSWETSRSTSATIQPNILRYLTVIADGQGVDLRPLLKQVGLDEAVMRSAALRVSYRQGSTVIGRALEL